MRNVQPYLVGLGGALERVAGFGLPVRQPRSVRRPILGGIDAGINT